MAMAMAMAVAVAVVVGRADLWHEVLDQTRDLWGLAANGS